MMKQLLFLLTLTALFAACETDDYDHGEGKYSLMTAEMGELTTNSSKKAVGFVTDDGAAYAMASPFTMSWLQTADTTYRAILYFEVQDDGAAKAMGAAQVPTLKPREWWMWEGDQPQDPVGIESSWASKNGKYINLALLLRTAKVDDEDGQHKVGVVQDTILVNADHTRTAYYRFCHDQQGVPEYYTNRRYVSILLPDNRPDTVRLDVVTYGGTEHLLFPL